MEVELYTLLHYIKFKQYTHDVEDRLAVPDRIRHINLLVNEGKTFVLIDFSRKTNLFSKVPRYSVDRVKMRLLETSAGSMDVFRNNIAEFSRKWLDDAIPDLIQERRNVMQPKLVERVANLLPPMNLSNYLE